MKRFRRRRWSESGLTLIEVVVSIAVLSIVGLALGAAADLGIITFRTGGVTDRIAGTRDISSFEQQLGGDVSRAACISISPATGSSATGSCSVILGGHPGACSSASTSFLCVSWPEWGSSTCHSAVYSKSGAVITRAEYVGASATATTTTTVTTDAVQAAVMWQSIVGAPFSATTVTVTLTSLGVKAGSNPPKGTLLLRPLASNPQSGAVSSIC